MANKVYESKEYDRLVGRRFKAYSLGHQKMYTKAIDQIKPGTSRVFEAGFGIGFGLVKMVEAGILERYLGCEPNQKSFDYVRAMTFSPADIVLMHEPFSQVMADRVTVKVGSRFDEAFCIEVIEHVPMDQHLEFLIALRQMAPRLWFSSPDKNKSKEGVRTIKEWTTMLRQARFETVEVDTSEWTYLYQCR